MEPLPWKDSIPFLREFGALGMAFIFGLLWFWKVYLPGKRHEIKQAERQTKSIQQQSKSMRMLARNGNQQTKLMEAQGESIGEVVTLLKQKCPVLGGDCKCDRGNSQGSYSK